MVHLMRHASKKIQNFDKQMILLLTQARNQGGGRRGASPSLERCVVHRLKLLDVVQKFGPLPENSSPLLVSQAGYGPVLTHSPDVMSQNARD